MTKPTRPDSWLTRNYKSWPKWVRVILISFICLIALLMLAWAGVAWYVKSHKKELLANITRQLSEQVDGTLTVSDIEPAFWKDFPNVSLRLKDVKLSDSLVNQHKHPLMDIKDVYLKIKTLSLLSRHPELEKLTVANGTIYLYVAENGYSNTYLLKKKGKKKKGGKKELELHLVSIEDIRFIFEHRERNKKFEVYARDIDARIDTEGDQWNILAETDARIEQLAFNLDNGGFLTKKDILADLRLIFVKTTKELKIPKQLINVDDEDINLSGAFRFGQRPVSFSLVIDAPAIPLKKGASMVSRNIARHFDKLELRDPLKIFATVDGKMSYPDTPIVNLKFAVKNNELNTQSGLLTEATFSGEFNNEGIAGVGHSDENSIIAITHAKARWEGIPFEADSVKIINLIDPVMNCRIYSKFPVSQLNKIAGSAYEFSDGQADFDLVYHGPLRAQNTTPRSLKGNLNIRNARITYLPRDLEFRKCNATLAFSGEDLYMKDIVLASKRSVLYLEGTAKSFLSAYFSDPNKVMISWNIRSNLIDLNEFRSFLTPRKKTQLPPKARNRKIKNVNTQLDDLLAKGSMNLNMVVKKLTFRKFTADNIKANVDLLQEGISLKNVQVQHSGGTISLNGTIHQAQKNNPFEVKAQIKNVKVDKLFYAFENFGQQTLDAKNLQGNFSANIDIAGGMTETADIIPQAFKGKIDFELNNGALVKFAPLEAIQKFAFKKRNLSNITFTSLSNRLDIDRGKIIINPMTIESSALIINVKGVYALDKGTDISMEVPLRNPQKDRERIAQGKEPRKRKGIVIYLRAQDGDDGKVHITWDPLKKGEKELDEKLFQEQAEEDE